MHSDGSLRQIIDSCFLRPTSRVFITSIMWLLARWDFALAAICFAIAGGYFLFLVLVTHHIFWEINFYAAVVKAMAAGMSPYNNDYIYNYHDLGYSTGFIYLVSRTGVTGERAELSDALAPLITRTRAVTDLPLAAGFGISTPEQAGVVAKMADGVVVGSAIVRMIEKNATDAELEAFARSLRDKMNWRA